MGGDADHAGPTTTSSDTRAYVKYLLREGSATEKRELLANLKSRLTYKDKTVTLLDASPVAIISASS